MFAIFIGATLSLDLYFCAIQPTHFVFVIVSFLYLSVLSFLFRNRGVLKDSSSDKCMPLDEPVALLEKAWVKPFAMLMGMISIVVPWGLILADERRNLGVLAPHLYLTCSQVAMEIASVRLRWATPARVLVPLVFTAVRLPVLFDWYTSLCGYGSAMVLSVAWTRADRLLAFLNLVLWSGYFFAVHIPRSGSRPAAPPAVPGAAVRRARAAPSAARARTSLTCRVSRFFSKGRRAAAARHGAAGARGVGPWCVWGGAGTGLLTPPAPPPQHHRALFSPRLPGGPRPRLGPPLCPREREWGEWGFRGEWGGVQGCRGPRPQSRWPPRLRPACPRRIIGGGHCSRASRGTTGRRRRLTWPRGADALAGWG